MSAGQALAEAYGPDTNDPLVLAVYQRQRELRGAEQAIREFRHDRDEAVRAAARGGVDRRTLVKVAGLAESRISQIVNYRR